jgi:hypothetical protein
MTPQPSLQRPTDASTVHRTRAAEADACLFAAALFCPLPSARWRRQPAVCCFVPTEHPAPSVSWPTAMPSSLHPCCKIQSNALYVALPCFVAAHIPDLAGRLHSCEPCLDRPAQHNPTRLSRRLDDSASGSDQNMLCAQSAQLQSRVCSPHAPNHDNGLHICAVLYLRRLCKQPCTLLQPASQYHMSA